jgi:hypothetical protein
MPQHLYEHVPFVRLMKQSCHEEDSLEAIFPSEDEKQKQIQMASELLGMAEEHGVEALTPVLVAMKYGFLKNQSGQWERCD